MSWITWAILSAVFAAATALLAKVGVAHVDSNLAMALRTSVVVVFAWAIVFALGERGVGALAQLGPASRVAPIDKLSVPLVIVFAWLLLGEKLTAPAVVGGLLITAGAVVIALG
jgi:transporter family protein